MQEKHTRGQENIDQVSKCAEQVEYKRLGKDAVTCQICKRELREGDTVTVYTFQAAGTAGVGIGYVMCGADRHAHPTEFLRGVDEFVVTGRIGMCTDAAIQISWLVLLAPTVSVVSPASSTSPQIAGDSPRGGDTTTRLPATDDEGQPPLTTSADDHTRSESGE